jgi:hypothetical protein
MYAEILSVTDDEYQRILEDLELMAEERVKTLIEASNREHCQPEVFAESDRPTFSEVRTTTNSKSESKTVNLSAVLGFTEVFRRLVLIHLQT